MDEDVERAGLVFLIPADYPLVEEADALEAILDGLNAFNVASLRVDTTGLKREAVIKRADILREIGYAREIAVLVDNYVSVAQELGLDGVHLSNPDAKSLRDARKQLGKEAIIGVFAGASKHDGMVLAEIGVDYVSYGPLGDRDMEEVVAPADLFAWWSEMIEVPLLAEGGLDVRHLREIKDYVDFVVLGEEVFNAPEPQDALHTLLSVL